MAIVFACYDLYGLYDSYKFSLNTIFIPIEKIINDKMFNRIESARAVHFATLKINVNRNIIPLNLK